MNEQYDYLVVGAGLFGAVFAHEAALRGKRVKVIEKRDHIAGNIYTKEVAGIQVHQYGAHIFHTLIVKFGITLINLRNLTVIRIAQLLITRATCTTCRST